MYACSVCVWWLMMMYGCHVCMVCIIVALFHDVDAWWWRMMTTHVDDVRGWCMMIRCYGDMLWRYMCVMMYDVDVFMRYMLIIYVDNAWRLCTITVWSDRALLWWMIAMAACYAWRWCATMVYYDDVRSLYIVGMYDDGVDACRWCMLMVNCYDIC